MSYTSIWPAFVCMGILLLAASLPVMRAADTPPALHGPRVSSLDGLRGILAYAVFFHHVVITYGLVRNGVWDPPSSRFYALVGPAAVDLFFMITGYLFWGKALKDAGQLDLRKLYIGRFFRIAPLYWFAIGCLFLIVAVRTGFHLAQPARSIVREAWSWLVLGLVEPVDLNGYRRTTNLIAGVTWTLRFEWLFYLSLAVTGIMARWRSKAAAICATAFLLVLPFVKSYGSADPLVQAPGCAALFLAGMICASLEYNKWLLRLPSWQMSTAGLLLLVVVLNGDWLASSAIPIVLLSAVFYLIICGSSFFGLLTSRAARRLGNISYGIYLLQGLVLTIAISPDWVHRTILLSPIHYWSFALACGLVLMIVSTATHVLIERPFIRLGEQVGNRRKPAIRAKAASA